MTRMRIPFNLVLCAALTTAAAATLAAQPRAPAAQAERTFRAGASTSNITPPLGTSINGNFQDRAAEHIHDELHARCLVLDDGKTQLAFVVVDSCMLQREVTNVARRTIQEQAGLPESNVMISATHSHSCGAAAAVFQSRPDLEYVRFLARRIADGVRRAKNNLAPARVGWGSGQVPEEVFNRRFRMKPGTPLPNPFGGTDQVKMNPGARNPNILEPAGPTDPEVFVLSLVSPAGQPIALLANYSLHYVGGTGPGAISADYYGYFADRVQELLKAERQDPPFVAMMSNGTSGDINNIDVRAPAGPRPAPYEKMRQVGHRVAAEVLRFRPGPDRLNDSPRELSATHLAAVPPHHAQHQPGQFVPPED